MFCRPRKKFHSDSRVTYESVHEDIMARLDESDTSKYLCDMHPLLEKLNDLSQMEARKLFYTLAKDWMTPEELHSFSTENISTLTSDPPNWCVLCQQSTRMVLNESEASMTCDICGCSQNFIGPSSDRYLPWDHEAPPPPCPYKRSNHFNEYLDSFMARQSGSVPDEVFGDIFKELKKYRITDFSTLTHKRLREIMKKLRLNKYYESAPFILYKIKGEKPPEITPAIEQELKSNFDIIQAPFERVTKQIAPDRKNFLSYSYTIFKMLQLMELDHLLEYFTLLKSRDKLMMQDRIWKAICLELGWRYIPSI